MDEVLRAMNEENERLMKQSKEGWSESVGSLFINNVGFDLHRMRTIGYRPHTYDCLFTQAGGGGISPCDKSHGTPHLQPPQAC